MRFPIGTPLTRVVLATAVAASMAVAGCQPSPPAISDPKQILVQSLQAVQKAKTVHLAATLDGALPVNTSGSTTPITLDGTTADADVDVVGSRLHATFKIPTLFGLSGEIIEADGKSYLKTSFTEPKYIADAGGIGAGGIGAGSVASPGDTAGQAEQVAGLRALLDQNGVRVEKNADTQCGSRTCYQVTVVVPAATVSPSSPAATGGSPLPAVPGLPSLPIDLSGATVTFVVTVDRETLYPATISATAALGAGQELRTTLTTSNWDAPVSIEAPTADQIGQGSEGLQLPFPVPSGIFFPVPSNLPLPTM